ncbi:MAG: amino acid ABC transporter ATP-binding protein [Alphaproteobacteria bacterium]|nr:amino acid ABC transporter ATP-binding protein [Alphaproteobacteria bacterium]
MVKVEALHKSYGDLQVLKNVNVEVPRGRSVVVIGPSGSGKSTLLRCLNLLEPIDSGIITFDGQDTAPLRKAAHALRREIGMVFQNFELFQHLSAIENIILAPMKVLGMSEEEARARARKLLEKVHIPEKADVFPDELSGGQQQRVAIARALAMSPKLMLYDEPTSALDPEMIKEVLDVMLELSQEGMTSVVVTHEMGFARRAAHHIVFMDGGEVVEDAATEQFFTGAVHPRTQRFLQQILR